MVSFNVNRADSMAGWLWSIEKEKIFMINLNSKIYSPLKNEKKSPRLWLLSMAWLGLIRLRWWQNENKKRKKAHINTHNHKHIHLLRHLNEISLVIPFSFLMMEILKFLALSPTWISKQCMIACIYVVEMKGGGSTQLNTTHSARLNWYTCQTIKIINIQVNYKKGAFAHSFRQNYRIPSCDLNEHACNWVGCRYFSYCWLAW